MSEANGNPFRRAVKHDAKGRIALVGPAGSGKTYTALVLATRLAAGGRIAAIDTEHGSMEKYADHFDFDVMELDAFSPQAFMGAIDAAARHGYAVFLCDSLSHFWIGREGALEFVDNAARRHRDQMGGWKDFRPHERAMVDAMIASPCHVICTMRTKTDYQEQVDPRTGKKVRVKIGLAPVQRDGLEYEFDLVGYMDEDNTLIVDKTRCPAYSQKSLTRPSPGDFDALVTWLAGATPKPRAAPASGDAGGGDYSDAPPFETATAEQINEVMSLVDGMGSAGPSYQRAVFSKHGGTSWTSLRAEVVQGAIEHLKTFEKKPRKPEATPDPLMDWQHFLSEFGLAAHDHAGLATEQAQEALAKFLRRKGISQTPHLLALPERKALLAAIPVDEFDFVEGILEKRQEAAA